MKCIMVFFQSDNSIQSDKMLNTMHYATQLTFTFLLHFLMDHVLISKSVLSVV